MIRVKVVSQAQFLFNSLHAGYFFMLLLSSATFFKIFFREHYQNVKRFGCSLSVLIWVFKDTKR